MNISTARNVVTSALLLLFIALTGCGGGGGTTTTPTDPNQLFNLTALNSTTPGSLFSTQLAGSTSLGQRLTGSASLANRAQIMLAGVLVTPRDLILSVTDGISSVTITGTSYVDTSGNLISLQTSGISCTPVSPDSPPTTVKIGDFGILSTLICDDNTTQDRSWRVEDGGNGTIRITSNGTTKNQFNNIVSIGDVTYTIDGNGDILSIKIISTDVANNYTLTMQST